MLDKAIEHKKEHRKPYRYAKAVNYQCRNHGSCIHCEQDRRYQEYKSNSKAKSYEKEYQDESNIAQ